ncbi:MAG: glyoxylate/hydroxypyruvate reductase A, partial [Alphaproteobacteria bacterium]|nr:glyoxylate/hydroxypyruvate reductase A [Alphaproteobacteria bacterium]
MKILFASSSDDPAEWVPTLKAELPGADIVLPAEMGDPESIDYALAWKPPPGLLASLPNLKAILSLGAGVDALLADPTLPDGVPLARMVDPGLTVGMTDYVCWQVLAAHRRAADYRALQAEATWRPLPETLAPERKVGIRGLGE